MEKQSLNYRLSQMKDSMKAIEVIKANLEEAKTPIDKAQWKRTLQLHEGHLEYISKKIDEYGSGLPMVQVTGQRWIYKGEHISRSENFVFFLYGVTEDEAKLIMKAQAIKNNLIERSLRFRAINFRTYITI